MNIRLVIAYDGTDFRGLAPNAGVRTVVGELERVLADLCGRRPEVIMSGRTDAGVHARTQVLSFTLDPAQRQELERRGGLTRLQRSVNTRLGPEILVRRVDEVDPSFSARFSATSRSYRYTVDNRPVPDPLQARYAWSVPQPLDVVAMQTACQHVVGEHDFSSFCRAPKPTDHNPSPSLVRRVTAARWIDSTELGQPGLVRFDIDGSAFCHQMVRSIVGLMVDIGRGRRNADEVLAVLAARDRSVAAQPAPPHGLVLWDVGYPDGFDVGADEADGDDDTPVPMP